MNYDKYYFQFLFVTITQFLIFVTVKTPYFSWPYTTRTPSLLAKSLSNNFWFTTRSSFGTSLLLPLIIPINDIFYDTSSLPNFKLVKKIIMCDISSHSMHSFLIHKFSLHLYLYMFQNLILDMCQHLPEPRILDHIC